MNFYKITLAITFIFFYSLGFTQETYKCKEIGWSIQVPNNWEITIQNQMAQNEDHEYAQDAFEETTGERLDVEEMKYLIFFQRNQKNIFQSTLLKQDFDSFNEWQNETRTIYPTLAQVYLDKGLKIDTLTRTEKIDNIEFDIFEIEILDDNGNVIIKQEYYGTFIKGYELGITITYNDFDGKQQLKNSLANSKFK